MAYNAAAADGVMRRIAAALDAPDAPSGLYDLIAQLGRADLARRVGTGRDRPRPGSGTGGSHAVSQPPPGDGGRRARPAHRCLAGRPAGGRRTTATARHRAADRT